jgi:transcriptional regulator with XRE-family HTH domain
LARGLTQETFAERAGLGYKHYQQVEAGRKSDLRLSTLIKMAAGLGLKLNELVDFDLAPLSVAEDPGKYGTTTRARKSARKSASR